MEKEWIVIRGMGSVSPLGASQEEIRQAYTTDQPFFQTIPSLDATVAVAPLSAAAEEAIHRLCQENPTYATLDRTVQMAIVAARQAVAMAGWPLEAEQIPIGINLGSSRGATGLFEQYHAEFLQDCGQRLPPATSPNTTLGNLASWVAQDLQTSGPMISHSVTCSTALQAFANGVAWLRSGMAKRFLVGGTEAPLTPFTIAQMKSVGIYSPLGAGEYPCRPLGTEHRNTFVLGEGAAVFALERMTEAEISALTASDIVVVEAVGLGFEQSPSKTGISREGLHFQQAMREALHQAQVNASSIDGIVLHAPGTKAGDNAEQQAITAVFGTEPPTFLSNKWRIGHTLGASGALGAELAFLQLTGATHYVPGPSMATTPLSHAPQKIMVNAAGFGGNAACLLLSRGH